MAPYLISHEDEGALMVTKTDQSPLPESYSSVEVSDTIANFWQDSLDDDCLLRHLEEYSGLSNKT